MQVPLFIYYFAEFFFFIRMVIAAAAIPATTKAAAAIKITVVVDIPFSSVVRVQSGAAVAVGIDESAPALFALPGVTAGKMLASISLVR